MTNVIRHVPDEKLLRYTFGAHPPVAHLAPDDVLVTSTQDCFGGAVRSVDDLPSAVCAAFNPVTGPFHVAGAEPGDTLALHFAHIEPARDWGMSSTFPHFGALTTTHTTAMLHPPLEERVWRYDIDTDAGTVTFRARRSEHTVTLPLEPMLGTVGVAPAAGEARATIVPDGHGGNLDTPEIRPGTTVYLGVNVPGALFAFGDGHARQGQGEVCGVAVETAMNVTVVVGLIKGTATPWPRIESNDRLISIGAARPLEDAYRISQTDLIGWVSELTGLETLDAYQLISQAGTAAPGNVCDPNYTMHAAVEKAFLPGSRPAYDGMHDRLGGISGVS